MSKPKSDKLQIHPTTAPPPVTMVIDVRMTFPGATLNSSTREAYEEALQAARTHGGAEELRRGIIHVDFDDVKLIDLMRAEWLDE